jgi:hypothetical protein
MHTLIQLIETRWTKQSRGAPGAAARNAVPEVIRFAEVLPPHPVLFQHALFVEHQGFAPPAASEFVCFSADDSSKYRLTICHQNAAAEISFFGTPFTQTSGRPTDVVRLEPDTWLRIIGNQRVSEDWGWTYRKFVYNIVHAPSSDVNALVANKAPVTCIDREKHLW